MALLKPPSMLSANYFPHAEKIVPDVAHEELCGTLGDGVKKGRNNLNTITALEACQVRRRTRSRERSAGDTLVILLIIAAPAFRLSMSGLGSPASISRHELGTRVPQADDAPDLHPLRSIAEFMHQP